MTLKNSTPFTGRIRINKKLKDLGLAGRREADMLIEKGYVFVNGKKAILGQKVNDKDILEVKSSRGSYVYYMFYKPPGVVSHDPQYGEDEVRNFFSNWDKDNLTLVGRLDKHSEGLMLITNDKRMIDKILNPEFDHEKEYEVTTHEKISKNIIALFKKGFEVYGRWTAKPVIVDIIADTKMKITLTEGKKHQIRLMLNEMKYTVSKLKRIRIMTLKMGNVGIGEYRALNKKEIDDLLKATKLKAI
jgi:23S rRNA pseudouridine2604 synthase